MANEEKKIWGIHTRDDNLFLKDNLIAIGWHEMGDLSKIGATRDAFKEKYSVTFSDAKKGSIATGAGMLYRFCYEAQVGDYVVFPSKINREVNIGVVEGDYVYDSSQPNYVQTRMLMCDKVTHKKLIDSNLLFRKISRNLLSKMIQYNSKKIFF